MAGRDHRSGGDQDAGRDTARQIRDTQDQIGDERDRTSGARDDRAGARDEKAEARDTNAEARDTAVRGFTAGAASDRAEALRDRREAASDRAHAAADRTAASSDRVLSAGDRVASSIDGLTGAHRRDAGFLELARDIARAKRTGKPFVLVFVDVDGLKATNDSLGHAAGDRLLCQVVDTIRSRLRLYDLIVRFGGDEFVCGLLDLQMEDAAERFLLVKADLTQHQQASVTVGLAELREDDLLEDLILRADEAMYIDRQQRPSPPAEG
jgi:diguanylate cyclase (GGDEF)-like protein